MKKNHLLLRLVVLVTAMMCALGASAYDFEYGGYYYNILTDSTVADLCWKLLQRQCDHS